MYTNKSFIFLDNISFKNSFTISKINADYLKDILYCKSIYRILLILTFKSVSIEEESLRFQFKLVNILKVIKNFIYLKDYFYNINEHDVFKELKKSPINYRQNIIKEFGIIDCLIDIKDNIYNNKNLVAISGLSNKKIMKILNIIINKNKYNQIYLFKWGKYILEEIIDDISSIFIWKEFIFMLYDNHSISDNYFRKIIKKIYKELLEHSDIKKIKILKSICILQKKVIFNNQIRVFNLFFNNYTSRYNIIYDIGIIKIDSKGNYL